jgi:GxxExxY protein
MTTNSFFLESLLVPALATKNLSDMRKTIPYLRNRCMVAIPETPSKVEEVEPVAVGSSESFVFSSRRFHVVGKPLSFSSERDFVVKRLSRSNGARGVSARSTRNFKTDYSSLTCMNKDVEFKPWCLDWANLLEAAGDIYMQLGDGHSEKAYQTALLYKLYQLDVPCLMERPIYVTENSMSILAGRVDLEVNKRFLLELKVSNPTEMNVRKDRKQLRRYVAAYQGNGVVLERAALVYFCNSEVRVVEVAITDTDNRYTPY